MAKNINPRPSKQEADFKRDYNKEKLAATRPVSSFPPLSEQFYTGTPDTYSTTESSLAGSDVPPGATRDFEQGYQPPSFRPAYQSQLTPDEHRRALRRDKHAPLPPTNFGGANVAAQEAGITEFNFHSPKALIRDWKKVRAAAIKLKSGGFSDLTMDMAAQAGQQFTGQLLKTAWTNIIDTFGVSFLYVILHWFCRYSHVNMDLREYFCPFGSEWTSGKAGLGSAAPTSSTPAIAPKASPATKTAASAANQKSSTAGGASDVDSSLEGKVAAVKDKVGKTAEYLELGLFYTLCFILFLALIVVAALVFFVLYVVYIALFASMSEKWETRQILFAGFKALWDAVRGVK